MQVTDTDVYDITIIGGGPTGLFAAFYAGLRTMRTKIIDSLDQLGGQLAALYPEKFIYDVAGFPAVLARTLASELIKQALQSHPTVVLGEQVQGLTPQQDGTIRISTDEGLHASRTILVAAGGGSFTPKRLPVLDPYEGRGVYYSVRDPHVFRGKRVLVVGGGDSAVDWALTLSRFAAQVTLIHRHDQFRAHEESVRKLKASQVSVLTRRELKSLSASERVKEVKVVDSRTRQEETLPVDAVLVNIGFVSALGPLRHWGLTLDEQGIVVGARMETSMPGVYAAGDIASYPGKLKLIATGFGEAAMAVNHAKVLLDPKVSAFPGHSTTLVPRLRRACGEHMGDLS